MKIKEIADTYGIKYVEFPPDIINSICFNKENACAIIEKLRDEVCPILGCDVYRLENGEVMEILVPDLIVDRDDNESYPDYLQRSCDAALKFVLDYPQYTNDLYFDFVIELFF